MTPHMAETLTNHKKANHILASLNHNNFFTYIKQVEPEPLYHYHSLFREFLLSKAEETLNSNTHSQLQRSAANILEESGHIADMSGSVGKSRQLRGPSSAT